MAWFTVYYQTVASIPVIVEGDFDHLGGKHFEEAIREAAEVEFDKVNTRLCHMCASDIDLGEFEQDPSDEGVRRHR